MFTQVSLDVMQKRFFPQDVDEVFTSMIQPSFLQGWWNYPIVDTGKIKTIDMYIDFQWLFPYQCSVWAGNDLFFLNPLDCQRPWPLSRRKGGSKSTPSQPQGGFECRQRLIQDSPIQNKQQQLMDTGWKPLLESSDF